LLKKGEFIDPSSQYQYLKTEVEEKEEEELRELVNYFDKNDDDSRNLLSYKVRCITILGEQNAWE
jgi:hypothetical protein